MSATISPCGKYRYWLSREGDPGMRRVAFVMLNPSTADADIDDATIRRCRTFARGAGFVVVNLYAFRATDPKVMKAVSDPVGPNNYNYLINVASGDYKVIAAWGTNARRTEVTDFSIFCHGFDQPIYCLGTTKDGHPRHPLYVRSDAPIIPWTGL